MPPNDENLDLLWDMLEYARRVSLLTGGSHFLAFSKDWRTQLATERALEIIGEAARRLPQEFRDRHEKIPWRKIIGLRNVLAHEYGEVRTERIWETGQLHIPSLIQSLEAILPDSMDTDIDS